MVVTQHFCFIILAMTFQLGMTDSNETEEEPCPTTECVDLIEGRQDTFGFFSPEEKWPTDDRCMNYPCNRKLCLSVCCPFKKFGNGISCIEKNASIGRIKIDINNDTYVEEVSEQNFNLVNYDPCAFDWMAPLVLNDFYVLGNGWIRAGYNEKESHWDFEHYCLFRDPESSFYFAKACQAFVRKGQWEIFCTIVVILVMVAIFIGYTVVRELRNFFGMLFRSYVASYFICAVSVLAVLCTTESKSHAYLYTVFERIVRCSGISCLFWLNVMNYNIWQSFRRLRSIDFNRRKREKQKFIWYAIYAWISPVIILSALIAIVNCVSSHNVKIGHTVKIWISAGFITIVYLGNTFFYSSTALRIKQHKRDTAHLANDVNKRQNIAEQWFNLHLKLFVIMGGHIIAWAIWLLWPTPAITHTLGIVEVVQSILIFVIFFWKNNIRQSFCERFGATLRRCDVFHISIFRCFSE